MFKKNLKKYATQSKEAGLSYRAQTREGKLYQRLGKTGENDTNALDWGRMWKQYKISNYPPELRTSLNDFVRVQYNIEELVTELKYEPELPTSKDCWIPSLAQRAILSNLDGDEKIWQEREYYNNWFNDQVSKNAEIKHKNDLRKAEKENIVKNGGQNYKRLIGTLMGEVLSDMTPDSRKEIEQWTRPVGEEIVLAEGEQREWIADNIEEAHEIGDWLFIFEAVMKTHLLKPLPKHDTAVQERRDNMISNLKKIKHESGSFELWIERFEDYYTICESAGCVIEDTQKRNFFMDGLNKRIFAHILVDWKKTIGRPEFPSTYDELKQQIKAEYNSICADSERARTVVEVQFVRSGKAEGKTEVSLESKETSKPDAKPEKPESGKKCWICEKEGHMMKDCWYYDPEKTKEENRAVAAAKESEKKAKRAAKKSETKKEAKTEKVNKCAEVSTCGCLPKKSEWEISEDEVNSKAANLKSEQCFIMGVKSNEVDFVYDSGTHHGVMGDRERDLLHEVIEDPVLLEGVGGHTTLSLEIGNSIFGQTRVLKKRQGSVLVSNYSTRHMFQVINPDPDTFILQGWESNPKTVGKRYEFIRDEERYGDPLLHCTLPIRVAKSFANIEKFYDPPRVPELYNDEAKDIVARVEIAHRKWSHASAQELTRITKSDPSATGLNEREIDIWKKLHGDFCTGCIEGGMKEHDRVKSTKPLKAGKPGEIGVADLMFVEGRAEFKSPLYVHVDVATKVIIGVPMKHKNEESCMDAFKAVLAAHRIENQQLKSVVFDRESAIMALEPEITDAGVKLIPKAAGQKVGLAEVNVRNIRIKCRSSKAGVRERYGYLPANQFNMDLCMDGIGVLNRIPKEGKTVTPIEEFTGKKPDWIRDLRAEWGEPIIVKKPKGIASDLKVKGEWAIVVRRIMNGTGVLKVYLVQSKKYAYRLKFKRATAPEWVIGALNSISVNSTIGFEDPTDNPEDITESDGMLITLRQPQELLDTGYDESTEPVADPVIGEMTDEQIEDAINVMEAVDAESETPTSGTIVSDGQALGSTDVPTVEVQRPVTRATVTDRERLELERRAELYAERVARGYMEPEIDDVDRVIFDRSHRRTEASVIRAQEVLRKAYMERYAGGDSAEEVSARELDVELSGILYQHALKTRPEAAEEALLKEVNKACEKKIWHPVHLRDLTEEQRGLILPMMKNYVEKYHPDSTFDKSKVRVLVRGDLQKLVGETEGPVCRFESILILLCIAIHLGLEVFKVDISAAYMNTPMNADVKHRWVRLDKDVTSVLLKLNHDYWAPYVQPDGTIVVEMDKLMYGFREAAKYWNVKLVDVFLKAGYKQCAKDKCLLVKREGVNLSLCAITVDDCLFACTRDENWVKQQIELLITAFEEVTIERGEELGIVGVQIVMDREKKVVRLSQKKYVDKVKEMFDVKKFAPNPALLDVMGDDDTSPLLEDQKKFMSLNSLLMFGATRTYPQIRPTVVRLSTKYNKASELDMKKAMRVAEYICGCRDEYEMVLAPKSLQLIAASDASYAENVDGTSNDGGCIGFESDTACWTAFVTGKQPIVAMSACEAELITVNKVGTFVEWARQLMEELGFPQNTIVIQQDSTCSIAMLKQGTGSFKRAKHIKVRYFWLKDLIDAGVVILKYVRSGELVADILTKPVTGAKFSYLLKKLIGWSKK